MYSKSRVINAMAESFFQDQLENKIEVTAIYVDDIAGEKAAVNRNAKKIKNKAQRKARRK